MMKTEWGRKETIVWPTHAPIYTYGAVLLGFIATCLFAWQHYHFSESNLRQSYTVEYVRSLTGSMFNQHGKYRLLYLSGATKTTPRLALPADFEERTTIFPDGRPVTLSAVAKSQGFTGFYRAPVRSYNDAALAAWLRGAIFGGQSLLTAYAVPLSEGTFVFIVALVFAARGDMRRLKELKYGRRLKGPIMLTPKQFNKTLNGGGMGIRTNEKEFRLRLPWRKQQQTILRLPWASEAKHIQVMGDTGAGKSTLLFQMLQQIQDRGDVAIVYDPAGEFTQRFYSEGRGDWILNPLDSRVPYWTPASELRNPAEARTIATSLYQPTNDKKGEFFTETPQKIFAHLLKYRPSPQDLVAWMSNEDEIDRRVEGTELASMIAKGAQQQRSGVLGSLGLIADSLRLLPSKAQTDGREWSANEWAEKREGWIFLTSTETTQEALRPLHSLWIDSLILRLLTLPKEGQTRAWFVIDELASLQRLPQFHTALTKGRKSNNPIIFGYQGKAQLEVIYGHLAEVMLSQPATKFVMKTAEPRAAKWASELIGEVEIERVRETVADGKRSGKSFTQDRQIEPLVMSSEIEGLDDLHTFVKLGNYVSRFSFPHMNMPVIAPAMMPRLVEEKELWFDPLTAKADEPVEKTKGETKEATETEPPTSKPSTPKPSTPKPSTQKPPTSKPAKPKPPTPSTDVKVQAIKPRKPRMEKQQSNDQQIAPSLPVVAKNNGITDQSQLL